MLAQYHQLGGRMPIRAAAGAVDNSSVMRSTEAPIVERSIGDLEERARGAENQNRAFPVYGSLLRRQGMDGPRAADLLRGWSE